MKKIIFTIMLFCLASCGGADSASNGAGPVGDVSSPPPTLVSGEGEVVGRAVFSGGTEGGFNAISKSYGKRLSGAAIHEVVFQGILPKLLGENDSRVLGNTFGKSVFSSPEDNSEKRELVDEEIYLGNGRAIVNGSYRLREDGALGFQIDADLSVNLENVEVTIEFDGDTYKEMVNGLVGVLLFSDVTELLSDSGLHIGIQMAGDLTLRCGTVEVLGDIDGRVIDMHTNDHFDGVQITGEAANISDECSGYATVDVGGEQMTCVLLPDCSGCKQPK